MTPLTADVRSTNGTIRLDPNKYDGSIEAIMTTEQFSLFIDALFSNNLIVSGEHTIGGNLQVTGQANLSRMLFPVADGAAGFVLKTDGNGVLYWDTLTGQEVTNLAIGNGNIIVGNGSGVAQEAEFSGAFGAVLHAGFRGEERIGCIIKA